MILYKEVDNNIYLSAQGHITARYCTSLKSTVFERLEIQPSVSGIYLDLSSCTYMDSTFLGLIAGFNKKMKTLNGTKIHVQNADINCMSLLDSMGIARIVDIKNTPVIFPSDMKRIEDTKKTTAIDILTAHENLMDISEDNHKKFSSLHHILSSQIQNTDKQNN